MDAEPNFHVGRPNLGDRGKFFARVNDILDRRWLSNNGPIVQEFEQKAASILGVKHALAMCNATAAIEIAARALGMKGEVILPSYTFIATAHALQWQGITPVFADIDPGTHNIDPAKIEPLITSRTTGIIGVHIWGRSCQTEAIESIATKHNLKVMYDASHAFGCSINGQMIGGFGSCEVFSFHATKFINCFEGGIITTNHEDLAQKIRLMRNFGFVEYDKVDCLGINGKMNEVCAAMGLTNLEAKDEIVAVNKRNYLFYYEELKQLPGISVISYDSNEQNNYQYVVISVDPELSAASRDQIIEELHAENIFARKYFWPGCHRMQPYCKIQPEAWRSLPQTERVAAQNIVLPTGQGIGEADVRRCCKIICRKIKT